METPIKETIKDVNWGEAIEGAYQRFLSYGHEVDWDKWKLYPPAFYNQLVEDKFVAPEVWRDMMPHARSSFIGELQRSLAIATMRRANSDPEKELAIKTAAKNTERAIEEFRSGEKDVQVALRAKQLIILKLFKQAKQKKVPHLYKPETST